MDVAGSSSHALAQHRVDEASDRRLGPDELVVVSGRAVRDHDDAAPFVVGDAVSDRADFAVMGAPERRLRGAVRAGIS